MPAYSYLKDDIVNTIENNSTEFSDHIPYLIEKAEDRLIKELDDSGLDYYSSFTFTASDPVVSLPAGTLVVRNVSFKTSASSIITPLLQRSYEYAIDFWGYASASTGTPRYYARKNNTSIYIVPTPASTLTGEIQYTKRPLALSSATGTSATTSNYFSESCYNALFYFYTILLRGLTVHAPHVRCRCFLPCCCCLCASCWRFVYLRRWRCGCATAKCPTARWGLT